MDQKTPESDFAGCIDDSEAVFAADASGDEDEPDVEDVDLGDDTENEDDQ